MSLENNPDLNDILEETSIDYNISTHHIESNYFDDIKHIKQNNPTSHKYNILHINIQSLPAKFDKLKELVTSFQEENIQLDFILLCETFLTDSNMKLFQIPG